MGLIPWHLGNQLETRSQREERRARCWVGGRSYVTPRCHVTPEVTLKAWPFPSRSQVQGLAGEGQQPCFNFSFPISDHEMQKKRSGAVGRSQDRQSSGHSSRCGGGGGGASRSNMGCVCIWRGGLSCPLGPAGGRRGPVTMQDKSQCMTG